MEMTVNIKFIGEITAEESVLNQICIWAREASSSYNKRGLEAFGKLAIDSVNQIHDQLENVGCYDRK